MSVSINYSAIPPTSIFYKRLQTEKTFAIFVVTLFSYGNGIFRFFEIDPVEVKEILDEIIEEYQDIFGTELEADKWVAEFRDELRRTRKAYPGIEDRRASLEKCANEIEERLIQELTKTQDKNINETVTKLIFNGDQDFASDLLPSGYWLGLVSAPLVQEGAEILQDIDIDTLFTEAEDQDRWYRDQFKWWKKLYLAAAERNEEILVTVS